MQTLVNTLAVAAILMTLLLGYFVVMTIARGAKTRTGLGENMPLWPGCPVAWLSEKGELVLNESHVGWESNSWDKLIVESMPGERPESPIVKEATGNRVLLYLPARNRGVLGWWVVKLEKEM